MTTITRTLRRFPTTSRMTGIVALTIVALGGSFLLGAVGNTQLAQGAAIAIVVLGLTWLTGWSGQISIGNSGFMAFGGYTVAIWANHHVSTPLVVSLLLATLVGGLSGLVLAIPATRLRGPYLAGITLAFATIVPQIATEFGSWTGGPSGQLFDTYLTIPTWFSNLFSGPDALLNATAQFGADLTIVVAGVAFLVMSNLFHSPTGRAVRLVRDNDVAAELVGVNLARTRTLAFVVAAALGGLGGALMILVAPNITPYTFSVPLSITLLSVMVLGGIGTLWGAVFAGTIYAFANTAVSWINSHLGVNPNSNLGSNMEGLLFSALLIVTMLTAPLGIAGGISRLRAYVVGKVARDRRRPSVTTTIESAPTS